jgi:hypothetical protein
MEAGPIGGSEDKGKGNGKIGKDDPRDTRERSFGKKPDKRDGASNEKKAYGQGALTPVTMPRMDTKYGGNKKEEEQAESQAGGLRGKFP